MNNFKLDTIDFGSNFELEIIGEKIIYNLDKNLPANEWIRIETKNLKSHDAPQLSSPCIIKPNGKGKLVKNSLGYLLVGGNNVMFNRNMCSIFSSCYSSAQGLPIINENFHKTTSLFTARKTIIEDWKTQKDEYLAPNESHELYEQFTYDSIVYSLFSGYAYQSSLRQITYKEKLWDIKNEFFWLSKNDLQQLAEENHYDELYKDARTSEERFVYTKLFGVERIYDKLSPDAKDVLDTATELIKKSIQMRKIVSEEHPEYHLNSWDAGYAQMKLVWKEYFKDEFKEFRDKYKALENRMRPMVYELGFLRK